MHFVAADWSSHISDLDSSPLLKDGNSTLLKTTPAYISAILKPEDTSFRRLACPTPSGSRYEYLRVKASRSESQLKYFFALDLHQCAHILPRLIGSIVETMRFLGPQYCVLSIVEGRSDDGTFEILKLLRPEIERIGARYFYSTSDLDPTAHTEQSRIVALAELRNQALKPLVEIPQLVSCDATIIFLNDVSICTEDILELIHQYVYQNADMVCAMDWTYVGRDPTFYDVWIARGMNGDSFFKIPEDGSWNFAWNLFWNDHKALTGYVTHTPFQVFSCWNGATVFTAKPIVEQTVRFRSSLDSECYQGEPQLFCKDLWRRGYGKIAVVPAVNLEYTDEAATRIKALKGYTSQYVNKDGDDEDNQSMRIEWETDPPSLIKCIPQSYANQSWMPWNE
ncbi:hypothetical protein MMC26_000623 [Xylographa opegraphella]|nr:hypothetical protein [Xylographa opegraphella]